MDSYIYGSEFATTRLLLFTIIVNPIFGSYPFFWKCPTHFPVKQNFTVTKYLGRWYEIEKFFELDEISGSCTVSDYSSLGNGEMYVDTLSLHKRTGRRKQTEGILKPTNATKKEGRFSINYKPGWNMKFPSTYWILDTDYGNYSIVWSCKNSGIVNFQGVWFLSRKPRATDFIRSIVYNKLRKVGIFTRILTHTEQTGCPQRFGRPHNKIQNEDTEEDLEVEPFSANDTNPKDDDLEIEQKSKTKSILHRKKKKLGKN